MMLSMWSAADGRCGAQVPSVSAMRFWRPLSWTHMDVVCGEGAVHGAPPLHVHEGLQVLLPLSPLEVMAGRATDAVDTDAIHFTAPLEVCSARGVDDRGSGARVMFIGNAVLSRVGECPIAPAGIVRDTQLTATFSRLFDELQRPAVGLDCISRLTAGLRALLSARPERMATANIPEGVLRARNYLRVRAMEHVTLDELAAVAFLSKFYLLRSFHRALGLTPHEYQMQLRLARARRLLAEGRPLSHVTYDAGFADQSHLTRRFAAFYGMTPERFARQASAPFVPRLPDRARDDEGHAAAAPAA